MNNVISTADQPTKNFTCLPTGIPTEKIINVTDVHISTPRGSYLENLRTVGWECDLKANIHNLTDEEFTLNDLTVFVGEGYTNCQQNFETKFSFPSVAPLIKPDGKYELTIALKRVKEFFTMPGRPCMICDFKTKVTTPLEFGMREFVFGG